MIHWPTFVISIVLLTVCSLCKWSEKHHKKAGSRIIQRLNEHHDEHQQMLTELKDVSHQTLKINKELQEMLISMKNHSQQDISHLLKTQKFNAS